MKHIFWILALGSALFGSNQYFLYQEVSIPKELYPKEPQEKKIFLSRQNLYFFKPQMYSYNRGVLIYDLYEVANHHGKQFKGIKVVGGISLNKMYASKIGENIPVRWILGSGVYLDTSKDKGLGALCAYSHTTLSGEIRARIAGQFLINNCHMLELSLQLPIFKMALFGYNPTRGENTLFMIRLLYGGD